MLSSCSNASAVMLSQSDLLNSFVAFSLFAALMHGRSVSGCSLEQSPTGHSFRTYIINFQKHAQDMKTSNFSFISIVRAILLFLGVKVL